MITRYSVIKSLIMDRFIDARNDPELGFSSFAFQRPRTTLKLNNRF